MERITVGSLVRHKPSGIIGLVTEHFMWDGDWGGFQLELIKPWRTGFAVGDTKKERPALSRRTLRVRGDDVERLGE